MPYKLADEVFAVDHEETAILYASFDGVVAQITREMAGEGR